MQPSPPSEKAAKAGVSEARGGSPARLEPGWRYHLLGVGGMGMSALAEVMHRRGFSLTGSDAEDGPVLDRLRGLGIEVAAGHSGAMLEGVDAVIYSPAVRPGHLIWEAVGTRPRISRPEALGALTAPFRTLAVTGTHGKTTCSAALAHVLIHAGWDPTVLVGGPVPQLGGGNARNGASEWAVVEADESDGGFTFLSPHAILLTNVEPEHLDHHGSAEAMRASFAAFLGRLRPDGVLVFCADDAGAAALAGGFGGRRVSYGAGAGADLRVEWSARGEKPEISVTGNGERHTFASPLFGAHNALNLGGVFALAREVGVPAEAALAALAGFGGVQRRQQLLGTRGDCRIIDDYAHHPTEVRATLTAVLERFGEPLTVVFQPHLYSRTRFFAEEFAEALRPATRVFVTNVYAAREQPISGVDGGLILAHLEGHPDAHRLPHWREAARWEALPPGTLLTMGAGDITGLGPMLLERFAEKPG